jgi:hypothetical protein
VTAERRGAPSQKARRPESKENLETTRNPKERSKKRINTESSKKRARFLRAITSCAQLQDSQKKNKFQVDGTHRLFDY